MPVPADMQVLTRDFPFLSLLSYLCFYCPKRKWGQLSNKCRLQGRSLPWYLHGVTVGWCALCGTSPRQRYLRLVCSFRRQEGGFQLTHSLFCTTYSTIAISKINYIHSPYKLITEIANIRMATTESADSSYRHYSTAISQSKLPTRKEVTGMICGAVTAP